MCLFPNFLFDAWLCLSVDDANDIFWEVSAHKYLKHRHVWFKFFCHKLIMPAVGKCSPVTICSNQDKQLLYVIHVLNWTGKACVFKVELLRRSTIPLTLGVHQLLEGIVANKYQQHYFAVILLSLWEITEPNNKKSLRTLGLQFHVSAGITYPSKNWMGLCFCCYYFRFTIVLIVTEISAIC